MAYSTEEKQSVLARYYASGMTMKKACAELAGFPTRATLAGWVREHEAGELDFVPIRVRGRVEGHVLHALYPRKTKVEAQRLLSLGVDGRTVAKRLNVDRGAVYNWQRKLRKGESILGERGTHGGRPGGAGKEADVDDRARGALPEWAEVPEGLDPAEEARLLREKLALAVGVLDALKAPGPTSLTNREKFLAGERAGELGCRKSAAMAALGISESTYHAQRAILSRPDKYAALRGRVAWEFEKSGRRFGAESVWAALRRGPGEPVAAARLAEGDVETPVVVSEKVVRRIMAEEGLVPVTAGRSKQGSYSSYAGEVDDRPENVPLGEDGTHDFHADAPGELLVTDVTEFKIKGCKAYFSPVIDCHDGLPVAWSLSRHPDAELSNSSLSAALERIGHGFTIHTDGGVCYRCDSWKSICEEGGIARSMSRKGRSCDNARAEGFFGLLKREFYHCRDWSAVGFDEFRDALDAYMAWYRDEKIKKSLGWMTIREYRESKGWAA